MSGSTKLCRQNGEEDVLGWEEVGDDEENEEDSEDDLRSEEFDLYGTLRLQRGESEVSKIEAQSRAAYHKLSLKWHPSNFKCNPVVCDVSTTKLKMSCGWFHKSGEIYDLCEDCYSELEENDKNQFTEVKALEDLGGERKIYETELRKVRKRDEAIKMFKRVSLAYRILGKDHELRSIYDTLGWQGLVKADVYAQESVFAKDAFRQYDDFFAGVDEDDRQYLLMNGPEALSEDEDSSPPSETDEHTVPAASDDGDHGGSHTEDEEEDPELVKAITTTAAGAATGGGPPRDAPALPPPPLPPLPPMLAAQAALALGNPGIPGGDAWRNIQRKVASATSAAAPEPPAAAEPPADAATPAQAADQSASAAEPAAAAAEQPAAAVNVEEGKHGAEGVEQAEAPAVGSKRPAEAEPDGAPAAKAGGGDGGV